MSALDWITEAKVVRVQPGDIVWLRTSERCTPEIAVEIKEQAKPLFPDNEIIVAADIDISLVRSEA